MYSFILLFYLFHCLVNSMASYSFMFLLYWLNLLLDNYFVNLIVIVSLYYIIFSHGVRRLSFTCPSEAPCIYTMYVSGYNYVLRNNNHSNMHSHIHHSYTFIVALVTVITSVEVLKKINSLPSSESRSPLHHVPLPTPTPPPTDPTLH